MKHILYLECYSGISGDMTVGALMDLGLDPAWLEGALATMGVEGYHLHFGRTKKCGIDAYDFDVHLEEQEHHHDHHHDHGHDHGDGHHHHHHDHRNLHDILHLIDHLEASDRAKDLARTMFQIVAEAESKAHGLPIEEVHFHEVGAVDSIVDIVGTALCVDALNVDKVIVSPLREGRGYVKCQHGVMPVPVPATSNIVAAHNLQLVLTDNEGEMVTPTGAAIAAALHCGEELPAKYRIEQIGIGAGTKEFKNANILRAMMLSCEEDEDGSGDDRVVKLETNLDDCSGEAMGFTLEMLLEAGALDAWYTPIVMKKSRPGYLLSVLCREDQVDELEDVMFRHTTTIGIRKTFMERTVLPRRMVNVDTPWGEALVKACRRGDRERYYPEYASVVEICRREGLPFTDVYRWIAELCEEELEHE